MKFTRSIETSDLKLFGSLEEAQKHELTLILNGRIESDRAVADAIIENAAKVMDILTTTERSRPGGRKINGHLRKKRVVSAPPSV